MPDLNNVREQYYQLITLHDGYETPMAAMLRKHLDIAMWHVTPGYQAMPVPCHTPTTIQ